MKTTLIIPALNEAEVIGDLIRRTPREVVDEVIVVDNGSTDGTGVAATNAGACLVTETRRGYGSACCSRPSWASRISRRSKPGLRVW